MYITGFPPSNTYTVIFVIINLSSKYSYFPPLKSDFGRLKVAEVFMSFVVKLHGFPNSVLCDRDKVLLVNFLATTF